MQGRKILHIINKTMPPTRSCGGANRVVDWLAKAQHELGHSVFVMSPHGTSTPYFNHIKVDIDRTSINDIKENIPHEIGEIECHGGVYGENFDYLAEYFSRIIQVVHSTGSGRNSVYVSKAHAEYHAKDVYAYNGVPANEYLFSEDKDDYLLFLAKVKRRKKGVSNAINLAKQSGSKLVIAGGRRLANPETWFHWHPSIKPVGFVDGYNKHHLLAKAKALIVPIQWEEPFGLTVIEAMISGTPVIASNRGAMPELIANGVTGFLCDTDRDFLTAIDKASSLNPKKIRDLTIDKFSAETMARKHLELLELAGNEAW